MKKLGGLELKEKEITNFNNVVPLDVMSKTKENTPKTEEEKKKEREYNKRNKGAEIERLNKIISDMELKHKQEKEKVTEFFENQMDNLLMDYHRVCSDYLKLRIEFKKRGNK